MGESPKDTQLIPAWAGLRASIPGLLTHPPLFRAPSRLSPLGRGCFSYLLLS